MNAEFSLRIPKWENRSWTWHFQHINRLVKPPENGRFCAVLPRRSQRISLSELCHIWNVWLTFLPQWWDNTKSHRRRVCIHYTRPKISSSWVLLSNAFWKFKKQFQHWIQKDSLVRDCFKDFCWNFVAHPNYINKNLIPDISGKA